MAATTFSQVEINKNSVSGLQTVSRQVQLNNLVKEYIARIVQSGTDAPVLTAIKNDFSVNASSTYNGVGDYLVNLAGMLTANKTTVSISNSSVSGVVGIEILNVNNIRVRTASDLAATYANGILVDSEISIKVGQADITTGEGVFNVVWASLPTTERTLIETIVIRLGTITMKVDVKKYLKTNSLLTSLEMINS